MPGQAIIDGFRGTIDFHVYMGVPCFRRWPKSPGRLRTPAVMEQWAPFSIATQLWHQVSPQVKEAYAEMAKETNLTARDMFMRGYLSGTLRYYAPVDELSEQNP